MRWFTLLTLMGTLLGWSPVSAFSADEPTEVFPSPAETDTPSTPNDGAVPVAPPAEVLVPFAAPSMDPLRCESYEELSERYPAPAQSLVPRALLIGPRFRGAGNRTDAMIRGMHLRYPYYNYRSPWTYGGPASVNYTIQW